ncbi:hypothetical protein BTO30_02385 [Domibacillus antri]|uniref:YtkA-like domain-containing protein n=1 Tax=Domibacillus antri TaxID=1714264 RepID=A0A1Q8Q8Z6_9BACI|nr:FixH family protein [Domibacillus antri]OLN23814.1 hypothetical protein BTO30_02385 [Domibacillus antri]
MKKWMAVLFMMLVFVLAACGEEKVNEETPAKLEPIEAKLTVPETAALNEKVTISTTVRQNGEAVDDADEVKYEIWKDGAKEEGEMIEAEAKGDGVYSIQKAFDEEAVYYVQVHVTARGLHTMPKSPVAVGNATVPADTDASGKEEDHEMEDHMNH